MQIGECQFLAWGWAHQVQFWNTLLLFLKLHKLAKL